MSEETTPVADHLTSTRLGVYVRAGLAVVVPVVVAGSGGTVVFRAVWDTASRSAGTRGLLVVAVVGLLVLELRWLSVLAGLLRFGGSASRWLAWQRSPQAAAVRRRRRFQAAACLSALVVGLALAEAAFRVFGLYEPWEEPGPVPDTVLAWTPNRLGIREEWDSLSTDDPRLRIALLGDSIVFGRGVAREETFCHLLEEELDDDWPAGVVTINLGRSGTAPGDQLELFNRLSAELRPDIVIHVLYPNDLGVELGNLLYNIHNFRRRPFWTGDFSHVLSFVEQQIRAVVIWNRTIAYFRGGLNAPDRDRAWQRLEVDVERCRDAVAEAGASYGLVMFPWLFELDPYPLRGVHARMGRLAERLGVPFFDLLDVFEGREASKYRLSWADEHPNALGHELTARTIAEFIRGHMLNDRSPGDTMRP